MISAIYLIALWVNVSVVQAQEQLTSQLNTDSNPQPSTVTASTSEPLTAKNSQRAEIVAALTAFNLIICLVLILAGTESETAQQFISACADMAKIGFGGLVALIATRGRRNV